MLIQYSPWTTDMSMASLCTTNIFFCGKYDLIHAATQTNYTSKWSNIHEKLLQIFTTSMFYLKFKVKWPKLYGCMCFSGWWPREICPTSERQWCYYSSSYIFLGIQPINSAFQVRTHYWSCFAKGGVVFYLCSEVFHFRHGTMGLKFFFSLSFSIICNEFVSCIGCRLLCCVRKRFLSGVELNGHHLL